MGDYICKKSLIFLVFPYSIFFSKNTYDNPFQELRYSLIQKHSKTAQSRLESHFYDRDVGELTPRIMGTVFINLL